MSSTLLSLRMRLGENEWKGVGAWRGNGRTLEIDVILVGDGEDVVSLVRLDGLDEVSF